ncbi:MAG TPA: TIM barrel protein [Acidimicrobiia bacterium]|nr:TIM barrel protein [Acidimicrobiia bacterium]
MTLRITSDRIAELEADLVARHERDFAASTERLARDGVDADAVITEVAQFSVAAPSWAVGTGGTRFGRFPGGGEPRSTEEKIDDIAALNAVTGANRTVSLHVPWDDPDDPVALKAHADDAGIAFDAMNSNTFQDNPSTTGDGEISYKFGSLAHSNPEVRKHALEHNLAVIDLGVQLGSTALTVWLADGMNYPGQANFRRQYERVADGLRELHDRLPAEWELFVEHKPYEPSFYASVNSDWGTSLLLAQHAGDRAKCLVDLGHHLPNTNIEQVVSRLAMVGRLGGFHFNDSKYGDDDLTVGAIHPYQFFLIVLELVQHGAGSMPDVRYMVDASHNLKDPIEDLIQATDQIQLTIAQALLVDRDLLGEAQDRNDPALAAEVLQQAYRSDVRPLVAEARRRNRAALSPLLTFRRTGYRRAMVRSRGEDAVASGL